MANFVPGIGNPHARLMIVGQAPGYVEDNVLLPFQGKAGEKLDDWLEFNEICRPDVWITNICKYYPPNDNLKRLDEIGVDIKEQISNFWQEVDAVRPNCILGLGGFVLKVLTGKEGITKYRGSVLQTQNKKYKVVCTYHPAHFLHQMKGGEVRDASAEVYSKLDVGRALEESKSVFYNPPNRSLWIAKNSGMLWEYLEKNKNETICGVDIETPKAWGTIPICCGISFQSHEAVSIPLVNLKPLGAGWSQSRSDIAECWRLLQNKVLGNPRVRVVGQNFKFDEDKLRKMGFWIENFYLDLQLAFKTVYPELPGNIGFINSILGREPFWKEEGKDPKWGKPGAVEEHLLYNAKDAAVEREMVEPVIQELREAGLEDFYFNPEYGYHNAHYLYMDMENRGLAVNFQERLKLAKKYKQQAEEIDERLTRLAGRRVKVFENRKDVPSLLYLELGLPKRGYTDKETGEFKVKCDEDTIVALQNNNAKDPRTKQILQDILDLRRTKKTLSTYVLAKPDYDGRMRTVYNIVGTETGRTSTKKLRPPVRPDEIGLAFQTMTKHGTIGADIRKMFIPDKGHVFMNFDLSQAEARIVMLLAGDFKGLELFDKIDIHALTASWCFGGTWEKWSKAAHGGEECPERFVGKTIRHAGDYDMKKGRCMLEINTSAKKYGIDLQVSEWRAGTFLDAFHKYSPDIRNVFHKSVRECIDQTRILINPFGRRREFLGRWSDELYREAFAQIPQSTVRDQMFRAMLRIRKRIPGIQFLLEAHDAFMCQASFSKVEEYYKICIEELEQPIDFTNCSIKRGSLVIPADCEVSETSYKDLKKFKPLKAA